MMNIKNNLANIFFIFSILFIISVTIFPSPSLVNIHGTGGYNFIPFDSISALLLSGNVHLTIFNILGNVFLFVPLGFILPLKFSKIDNIKSVLFGGFFVSLTIEILQIFLSDRRTDIDDMFLNVSGAAVGYAVYYFVRNGKFLRNNE